MNPIAEIDARTQTRSSANQPSAAGSAKATHKTARPLVHRLAGPSARGGREDRLREGAREQAQGRTAPRRARAKTARTSAAQAASPTAPAAAAPPAATAQPRTAAGANAPASAAPRRAAAPKVRDIAAELRRRVGDHKFDMWFEQARLQVRDHTLEVRTDSAFVAQRIESGFAAALRALAQEALGRGAQVAVLVDPDAEQVNGEAAGVHANGDAAAQTIAPAGRRRAGSHQRDASAAELTLQRRLPRLHALDDFVVGPTNQLACSTACRLAEGRDDDANLSPLFIHGECGVGKTHLLQGVCRRFIDRTGRAPQVRYVTGEQFTNEFLAAIKNGTTDGFRQRLRRLDLLAIDDVHFLANKDKTQSEFQHTLDAIALSGARVVLASDHHPHHIRSFSQSLVSRFLSGMVVKIERPDRDLRRKLIDRLAARRGLSISPPAADELAGRCTGSIRELEGVITRLAAYRDLLGQTGGGSGEGEVGLLLVEQVLREERMRPAHIVRIGSVIDAVCTRLGLTRADLVSTSRHRKIVLGRSMVVYLARELTTQSYPEIARALGRENHSTVHTADQRLRRQLDQDLPLEHGLADPARTLRELADMLRRDACRNVES